MATQVAINRKRGSLKAQLTRLETALTDDSVAWTRIKLEIKLKALEKISSSIEELRSDYYTSVPEDEDMTEIENSLIDLDTRIEELEVSFNQLLIDDAKNVSNTSGNASYSSENKTNTCKIKLPEIPLPLFNGKYEEWNMFKIEFDNIVTNNKELSDVQKLHYLHAALRNEAKVLERPEDTFESLFKALENRFENKRIMVNIHLKSILEFEKIVRESSVDLRRLIDVINKNIRALKNLGFERNDLSDVMLITIILEKLDRESRKQFELSINTSEIPNFDNLMAFLEKRSQTLESIVKNVFYKPKQQSEAKPRSFLLNSNNNDKKCVVCNLPHPLYKCATFIDMNFSERFSVVKRNRLCLSCFSGKHFTSNCKSQYVCNSCKSKSHHSLLHRGELFTPIKNDLLLPRTSRVDEGSQAGTVQGGRETSLHISEPLSNCFMTSNKSVVLATAMIKIKTRNGEFIDGRALLDSCSQIKVINFQNNWL